MCRRNYQEKREITPIISWSGGTDMISLYIPSTIKKAKLWTNYFNKFEKLWWNKYISWKKIYWLTLIKEDKELWGALYLLKKFNVY